MSDTWEHKFSEEEVAAFVRGRAAPELSQEITREMAQDLDLRAEVALQRGLKPALAGMATGMPPGELGWRRLETALKADMTQTPVQSTAQPTSQPIYWRIAAIALGVAVLVQGAFLAAPSIAPSDARFETASHTQEVFELAIAFRDDASIAEISATLAKSGAQLSDGPSAAGLFRVKFETQAARNEGQKILQEADVVSLVARP